MSIDLHSEWPQIEPVARDYGLDPYLIAAIRVSEAGRAGREYGVMLTAADDYNKQLEACCRIIRNYMLDYTRNPFTKLGKRIAYGDRFIGYIQRRYCPVGADNDPSNLNSNWFKNVWSLYKKWTLSGGFGDE